MEILKTEGLCFTYKSKYQTVDAVKNVTCGFEKGKAYAIVGKSGSGKTTLLSLLAGLETPTKGKIIFDGDVEKAIGIYLGENQEVKSIYSYTEKNHNEYYCTNDFRFDSLNVIQKEKSFFECGDLIELEVSIHTEKDWDAVGLRFEIHDMSGTIIGSMFSEQMYSFEKADSKSIRIVMDTSNLAPGRYTVDMVAFTKDHNSNDVFVDGVYPAFSFEVSDMINSVNDIRWLQRFWGSTRLSKLRVE